MPRISIRSKLFFGFGFLFFMIIILWIIGGYFIYDLSSRSSAMLQENYQTVESAKLLIESIDEMKNQQIRYFFAGKTHFNDSVFQSNRQIFSSNLNAVENNITEPGEKEVIDELKTDYGSYASVFQDLRSRENVDPELVFDELIGAYSRTMDLIVILWDMNMDAISRKNRAVETTAHQAFVFISLIGTICFLISALFLFRYPRNISRPLGALINGITEIANRNYSLRLDFPSRDELGELASAFNKMAARLDEYEHSSLSELLFEKKRIDTIINIMKDAIIGLNDKNEIIFSNSYACRIIRIDEPLLVGKNAATIAGQNPAFRAILQDILDSPEKAYKEFRPLRLIQDDKVRYFTREVLDVNISITGEENPIHAGIVVVLKNITRFLEQDEAKTNFMATISHELKTPISSLRLNLKLLDDPRVGALNQEQKEIVQTLKMETGNMLTITSDLLDLAQVESGNIILNLRTMNPAELLDYVKDSVARQARKKEIGIEYEVSAELQSVYADPEKTAWVLMNLINNAIQYSDTGSKIRVHATSKGNEIIFMIEDFGIGIEEQHLGLIFKKFYRIPGSAPHGTGLGLAISKEFIVNQKGRIWVESEPGSGSRFYFSLPVYDAEPKK